MVEPGKQYQNKLEGFKKNVELSHNYFKHNFESYHESRDFVFRTGIDAETNAKLDLLNKPKIEFNVLEAYLSRLRGEFAKQKPSIVVSSGDEMPVNDKLIQAVQGHMLAILSEANNNQFEYDVYSDLLGGGFSVIKVWTEYANSMSFHQDIKLGRVYEPTMCGFDPMARLPHKGDGRYCYELFPKSKEEFKKEYPNIDVSKLKFNGALGDFNWCYKTDKKEDVLLVCDYYEKVKKSVKIVLLSNGKTITDDNYKDYLKQWIDNGHFEQPASIIDERTTEIQTICRYRIIANKVIEYKETKFNEFPLIFVDGNSVLLKKAAGEMLQQFTRPYFYHAKGTQRLKNACGQTLGNEIENLTQVKLKVAFESLPENPDYRKAYTNPQQAQIMIYNAFLKGNPGMALPPPIEAPRQPIPPEIMNTFMACDQTIQNILGSYDASLGVNDNQLSGIAIIEAATQSNAAAMPYVVGFLQGLNQAAQVIVDQMPKCHKLERSISVVDKDGKRDYIKINKKMFDGAPDPESIQFDYSSNSLMVKVEAGTNFAIQKSRSLQQMGVMMGASQTYSKFINSKGLKVLVQNMEVHARDQLEEKAEEFMAEMAQQEKMQMEMQQLQMAQMKQQIGHGQQQQPNPMVQKNQIEAAKLQHQVQQDAVKNQLAAGQQSIDEVKAENDRLKLLLEAQEAQRDAAIRMEQSQTEKMAKNVDMAIAVVHEQSRHHGELRKHDREDARLLHDVKQANKPNPQPTNEV